MTDFNELKKMTIEELDENCPAAPKHDKREPVPAKKGGIRYFCRANSDNRKEIGCTYYEPNIATCAGEVTACRRRGESFPLLGHTYCLLTEDIQPRFAK